MKEYAATNGFLTRIIYHVSKNGRAGISRGFGRCPADVRTAEEYRQGHIEGFRNIPVDELRERLDALEPGKPVYVICQSGLRSYIACRILAGYGYDCYNFSGGFRFYDAVTHDRCLVERAADCGMDR